LIDGYLIAYGCEMGGERWRHACSPPGADDLEAVRPIAERVSDDKRSLRSLLEETGGDGLGDALVDGVNRLDPLAHVERSELVAVGGDARLWPDRLRVDEEAAGGEGGVDVAQSVHDALDRDASQRPAAERDVEALAREVERLGVVDGEADTLALLARQCTARRCHVLGVGIERVDPRGALGGEACQPTLAAADVEYALAVEADELGDRGRLDSGFVPPLH
jgi:hypothetical protein